MTDRQSGNLITANFTLRGVPPGLNTDLRGSGLRVRVRFALFRLVPGFDLASNVEEVPHLIDGCRDSACARSSRLSTKQYVAGTEHFPADLLLSISEDDRVGNRSGSVVE